MAGRRIPNNVHKMKGTARKHRHGNEDGPILESAYPSMPASVKDYPGAVKHWNQIKKIMEPVNIYTEADADALGLYCILWDQFSVDPHDFPAVKMAQMRLTRKDLYLDPEARAKLGGKKASKSNPFENL